jgi:hypothetical protein
MASMRELAMELLSRAGSGPVLQPTNVFGQDPDLPIGYGEGEISPLDAAAMSTMLVPGVGDVTGLAADVDMYMRDPESRNIPNYLLTAAGVLPFLPAASQVRKGIKAYHGSPHSFDRFSTEQIGTGEGAQAYGRGLYFAESEDVARGYRDALTGPRVQRAQSLLRQSGNDVDLAIENAKNEIDRLRSLDLTPETGSAKRESLISLQEEKIAELTELKNSGQMSEGRMYEVNIDVEPDELLDWDKPMAEQSALVKQAFNFDPPPKPNFTAKDVTETGSSNPSYKYSVGQFPAAATVEEALRAANKPVLMHTGPTGSVAYKKYEQALSDPMSDPSGAITAAQKLQEKGIKGIRYADAFTRHKTPDKRSMNYVIFDDRLITIAKKYGVAIPVAAAMLARMTGEDTSQSYQEET